MLGLGDLFSGIDPETMVLATSFLIFFAVINFSLSKVFKKDKNVSTIISLCVSLLSVYGITRTNFDLNGLFYSVGITDELLYIITPILALIFIFIISMKRDPTTKRRRFSLGRFLMFLGALMLILGFTPLIYRKAFYIGVGAGLIALGGIIANRSRLSYPKWQGGNPTPVDNSRIDAERKRQQGLDYLTDAARRFRRWALSQKNPKFVGSWAMFINWLGRGKSESRICNELGITQDDFVRIFNRYGRP